LIDIACKQSRTSGGAPRASSCVLGPVLGSQDLRNTHRRDSGARRASWKPGYACLRRSCLIKACPTTMRRISLANGNPGTKRDPVPNRTVCNAWRLEINRAAIVASYSDGSPRTSRPEPAGVPVEMGSADFLLLLSEVAAAVIHSASLPPVQRVCQSQRVLRTLFVERLRFNDLTPGRSLSVSPRK
jgi:hypothetical protein